MITHEQLAELKEAQAKCNGNPAGGAAEHFNGLLWAYADELIATAEARTTESLAAECLLEIEFAKAALIGELSNSELQPTSRYQKDAAEAAWDIAKEMMVRYREMKKAGEWNRA